ncbi:uncharacterized protein LOC132935564 [Metopolophium dirhodum]|uniref:uncharacterized protein LOC132935564 n=1 Tax=Metopolophium dirhodum TaxID=44670 RepID=UPI0029901B7B|nr:uncharacterized protein LOC132935564 [Metopolophium dirhodum]
MSEIDDVDIELLIGEVKRHKEIWNIADENYHDRTKKRSAWISICQNFFPSFDEKDDKERNDICEKLIKKWRNIKDNYTKSKKKNKTTSGQGSNLGRRYIYDRQLSFLLTAGAITNTQGSFDGNDEQEDTELLANQSNEEAETPPSYTQSSSSKKRKHDLESSLIDYLNTPIPSQIITTPAPEPNPDRSFFDSILPSIANLTEDQKIEFRCEVLNIIKRMRAATLPPQNYGYPRINQDYLYANQTSQLSNYSPQIASYQHQTPNCMQQRPPRYTQPGPYSAPLPQSNNMQQSPPRYTQPGPYSAPLPQSNNMQQSPPRYTQPGPYSAPLPQSNNMQQSPPRYTQPGTYSAPLPQSNNYGMDSNPTSPCISIGNNYSISEEDSLDIN